MAKTETEKQFDHLVSKVIWPHFKSMGYKKSGNNFRFYDSEERFGKIVNFQKSAFYSKHHIHFVVNIGLYLPDFEFYHTGKCSAEKFTEPICAVRQRIGQLTNKPGWYELDEETDIARLQQTLERDFTSKVIPYLNKVKTRADVIYHLIIEGSDYLCAQIKTLYYNGEQQRALNMLEREYPTAGEVMQQWLSNLKRELAENPVTPHQTV